MIISEKSSPASLDFHTIFCDSQAILENSFESAVVLVYNDKPLLSGSLSRTTVHTRNDWMVEQKAEIMNLGVIRWIISGYVFLLGLVLVQNAHSTLFADPNTTASDPDMLAFESVSSCPDPNTSSTSNNPIPGTLALNWLYQGKKPPTPLVGQENISFHTAVYPWPYYAYDRDGHFAAPWLYRPWDGYDYWRWYRDDFTYPINYAEVQIKLDAQTSLHFGSYFLSDPLFKP